MADTDFNYYEGFEGSIKLSELLYRHGKTCSTPGCPQQKAYKFDFCFACQKAASGHLELKAKEDPDHAS